VAQSYCLRHLCGPQRGRQHRLDVNVLGRAWRAGGGVLVHHLREQILVERTPVDANANGLSAFDSNLHDGAKVLVASLATHVARVDAVLGQRPGARGIFRQQQVPVVVKIANEGNHHAQIDEPSRDFGDSRGRLVIVDRDADQLRSGCGERRDLGRRARGISRVGVRHGLHDDRMGRPDMDSPDRGANGGPA